MGLTLRETILAHFRKPNLINFRKHVKFGTGWVDSLLNTLRALYNLFHHGLMHKSWNNSWASVGIVMFSCGSIINEKHLPILKCGVY